MGAPGEWGRAEELGAGAERGAGLPLGWACCGPGQAVVDALEREEPGGAGLGQVEERGALGSARKGAGRQGGKEHDWFGLLDF